ncbi:Cysteine-rich RLK (receptor-like protein kinase) 8 [Cucumis melo var. makuwa]|uniref:Cysteine-rich RLK (Receptor-like protein kinase) 8 n=1 Tax=Cucumis melo var. makuwa TaxID=1194695 RepID=A0A5A7T528_CUCMM|nr:Cysteine-rich RLK (receptor-like protein kinase) 8 [Cucumis melo var. makuwa]
MMILFLILWQGYAPKAGAYLNQPQITSLLSLALRRFCEIALSERDGQTPPVPLTASFSEPTFCPSPQLKVKSELAKGKEEKVGTASRVAKGLTQRYGLDYEEALIYLTPVAKIQSLRLLLSIAANRDWPLFQLDVPNAFLNGDLEAEVYMSAISRLMSNFEQERSTSVEAKQRTGPRICDRSEEPNHCQILFSFPFVLPRFLPVRRTHSFH